jgi:hypothetical protein
MVNEEAKVNKTDWESIAIHLAQRVEFAIQNLEVRSGTGLVMNMGTGKTETWREFMAGGGWR